MNWSDVKKGDILHYFTSGVYDELYLVLATSATFGEWTIIKLTLDMLNLDDGERYPNHIVHAFSPIPDVVRLIRGSE